MLQTYILSVSSYSVLFIFLTFYIDSYDEDEDEDLWSISSSQRNHNNNNNNNNRNDVRVVQKNTSNKQKTSLQPQEKQFGKFVGKIKLEKYEGKMFFRT